MPTLDWLKKEFSYGYSSGEVLSDNPDEHRKSEEARCGADYRQLFLEFVHPRVPATGRVMELGPGAGSWTRAFLASVPGCRVTTVDFQDVTPWLEPERHGGRLVCHRVEDSTFSVIESESVGLFFSFGVLCHNNTSNIATILRNALGRMKPGGMAIHQYGDWKKLDAFGWEAGFVPTDFRTKPDEEIWWPRNDGETMARIAREAGWIVLSTDLGAIARDGMILLQAPDGRADASLEVSEGLAFLEERRPHEALRVADRILSVGPPRRGAHMLRAAALLHLRREAEGLEALQREIDAFPDNQDAREALKDLAPRPGTAATSVRRLSEGGTYLNLGCGNRFAPGWRNFDIRPSSPDVERLESHLRLPLADGSADFVYSSHMLEHLPPSDVPAFLAECRRVLRPGGVVRIVVPDLEGIARQYLKELDSAVAGDAEASVRRDWMVLELLDQVARHRSGGEMMKWWARDPVPAEGFILSRVGSEARGAIRDLRTNPAPARAPEPTDPAAIGAFRLSGEVHRWMYDRHSLARLLSTAGFAEPRKLGAVESSVPAFAAFHLDTEPDGSVRKPDSLFMEATR
jgi:SAM-dependent methyltransferase